MNKKYMKVYKVILGCLEDDWDYSNVKSHKVIAEDAVSAIESVRLDYLESKDKKVAKNYKGFYVEAVELICVLD